ncbi:unnamed protein product, partial [Urochloa humidicola]
GNSLIFSFGPIVPPLRRPRSYRLHPSSLHPYPVALRLDLLLLRSRGVLASTTPTLQAPSGARAAAGRVPASSTHTLEAASPTPCHQRVNDPASTPSSGQEPPSPPSPPLAPALGSVEERRTGNEGVSVGYVAISTVLCRGFVVSAQAAGVVEE